MKLKIESSISKLCRWVETHDYKAYEPFDGNLSFLHALTFHSMFLERTLQQAVKRTPFTLRPWVGIRPRISAQGMGYMAWGYAKMFKLTADRLYADRLSGCLQWLTENRAPGHHGYAWGNWFPYSSRGGRLARLEPTIVWSSLIGQAFLEAYEAVGEPKYLDAASKTCDWIMKLPREKTKTGTCLSYVATGQTSIHNSNMVGAALLAKVNALTHRDELLATARDAITYSCSRQSADGSWFYGEAQMWHWIDNFHSGYNLDSLKRYIECSGDNSFADNLDRGFRYYKNSFFERSGRPKYYHNRAYPIDIQCASQAIDTLAFFSDNDIHALKLAQKVAAWTLENMQAPDGHFYYQDLGWKMVKTPMLHWGQATTFKALAHLLSRLNA